MYDELKNTIIDISRNEYKDFPLFLDGKLFVEYDNGFITKENPRAEAMEYLEKTDWYVIRFHETGVEIPENIKKLRQEARERII